MATGYVVTVTNPDVESANRIHSDEVARALGFRGALVPGVVTYGHMCPAVVVALGAGWLERGEAAVRFQKPVYDGESIEIRSELTEAGVTVRALNQSGEECATLTASVPPALPAAEEPQGLRLTPLVATLGAGEANPAGLLRLANRAVSTHFQISPWIHAGSRARHWRELAPGAEVEVLSAIESLAAKGGHKFLELDVLVLAGGEPLGHVRHTVIYELGG